MGSGGTRSLLSPGNRFLDTLLKRFAEAKLNMSKEIFGVFTTQAYKARFSLSPNIWVIYG